MRWKAFQFLARASEPQIAAVAPIFDGEEPYAKGLRALTHADTVEWLLRDDSPVARRFAVAAAARVRDDKPLRAAASSDDEEVKSWAQEALDLRG